MSDVLLVVPPLYSIRSACDGTSLVKATLARLGIGCDVLYLNVRFAEAVGERTYIALSENVKHHNGLVGEWLFAGEVFGEAVPDPDEYLRQAGSGEFGSAYRYSRRAVERLRELRTRVPAFLDDVLDSVPWDRYRIVGSVSGVFIVRSWTQILPTFALFRRLKDRTPGVTTLLGGPHCDGEPGAAIAELFPWVDYVCSGEAERMVPTLIRRLLDESTRPDNGAAAPPLPAGVIRGGARTGRVAVPTLAQAPAPTPIVLDVNRLPYPDYADYYAQTHGSRARGAFTTLLPLETSRGCWWGQKHHCTFCGLNGEGMEYRTKTAQRAAEELDFLVSSWGAEKVQVLDKILNLDYFETFLETLAQRDPPLDLFYATKANLTKEQVRRLARAGARTIQPGIESLSTPILRLMDKGVTLLQNVRLLKWCTELGIRPIWNILYGTPGEPAEEYEAMAALVPSLTHLEPPASVGLIHLHRFSPNFDESTARGLSNVRAAAPYPYVFPFATEQLDRLAQRFDFDYGDRRDPEAYTAGLRAAAAPWMAGREGKRPRLDVRDDGERLEIVDTRPAAARPQTIIEGTARLAYLALDTGATVPGIQQALMSHGADVPPDGLLEGWLTAWLDARLVLREGPRYLSLAADVSTHDPARD